MRRIFTLIFPIALLLTSCDFINGKITSNNLKGFYENPSGMKVEFSDTKATMDLAGTRDYRVEGDYLYLERFYENGADLRMKIVDDHTLQVDDPSFSSRLLFGKREDKNSTFKKIENR
ncbi:hypothetical protein [Rufibacter latericius]|nr:hypothetical protein [Rufibacter latericius]